VDPGGDEKGGGEYRSRYKTGVVLIEDKIAIVGHDEDAIKNRVVEMVEGGTSK
jgi:hypothetical protein